MNRDEISKAAFALTAEIKLRAMRQESEALATRDWSRVGELERLANDVCNVPSRRNQNLGAVTYTLAEARRELRRIERLEEERIRCAIEAELEVW